MEQLPKSEDSTVSFVYAMSTNILSLQGIYKVGVTSNLERRRKELSSGTASCEEFFISHFVRCRTRVDANRLEAKVKSKLDSDGTRYRNRREFFKVGTSVPLQGCFRECAAELCIEIFENISADPDEILEGSRYSTLNKRNIAVLNKTIQKYYFKGATDLAGLYMLIDSLTTDFSFVSTIHRELYNIEQDSENPKDLLEILCRALSSIGHRQLVDNLLSIAKEDEAENDEIFEWRDMVHRH